MSHSQNYWQLATDYDFYQQVNTILSVLFSRNSTLIFHRLFAIANLRSFSTRLYSDVFTMETYKGFIEQCCLRQLVDDKSVASCQQTCCKLIVETCYPLACCFQQVVTD